MWSEFISLRYANQANQVGEKQEYRKKRECQGLGRRRAGAEWMGGEFRWSLRREEGASKGELEAERNGAETPS